MLSGNPKGRSYGPGKTVIDNDLQAACDLAGRTILRNDKKIIIDEPIEAADRTAIDSIHRRDVHCERESYQRDTYEK